MVSVIIPVVNESATVGGLVASALAHPDVDEVIVVDDGSIDDTPETARRAGARVITSTFLGKGASLRDGMQAAKSRLLVFLDANLRQLPAGAVGRLAGPLADGKADLVVSTGHGSTEAVCLLTARPLLRTFFPELAHVECPLSGAWAARRSLLQRLPFEMDHGVEVGLLLDAFTGGTAIGQADIGPAEVGQEPLAVQQTVAAQVTRSVLRRAAEHHRLRAGYLADMEENQRYSQDDLVRVLQQADPGDRIALFDMDGVLVRGSFILELAHQTDKGAKLAEYLDDPDLEGDALTEKVAALFAGVPRETFEAVAHEMPLMEGARETVAALRKNGYLVGVVSDCFHIPAEIIRCRVLGDFTIAHLMRFHRGKATGRVTFAPATAPVGPDGAAPAEKPNLPGGHDRANIIPNLTRLTGIPAARVLALGNSAEDIGMLRSAGLSVAFRPTRAGVRAAARHVVEGALLDVLDVLEGESVLPAR